jgi:hypothetical protein
MIQAGQIVLFRFPQADMEPGKLRPALLLGKFPGPYDDWLISMVSSQTRHYVEEFDELVQERDADFAASYPRPTLSSCQPIGSLRSCGKSLFFQEQFNHWHGHARLLHRQFER